MTVQISRTRQLGLFEANGIGFEEAFQIAVQSFKTQIISRGYKTIAVGFSGGKDSTAVVTLLAYLIKTKQLDLDPRNIHILYGDTGRELPPLHDNAMDLLAQLRAEGFNTKVVRPELDKTFWVNMIGRGIPVSHQFNRWCVSALKTDQMERVVRRIFYQQNQSALEQHLQDPAVHAKFKSYTPKGREAAVTKYFNRNGEKLLMVTGMRLGESLTRDQKIETICSVNGECGTGMWQPKAAEYDRLAPLVRWRTCHIFDWLAGWTEFLPNGHGYERWTRRVAKIYGDEDVRTGCLRCSVASVDRAADNIVKNMPEYRWIEATAKLRNLWDVLMSRRDLRLHQDGTAKSQTGDLGPYTFEARRYIYDYVMKIQMEIYRLGGTYQIISLEERERIFWHWQAGTWPQGWDGSQPVGSSRQLIPTGQSEFEMFGA